MGISCDALGQKIPTIPKKWGYGLGAGTVFFAGKVL